MPNFSEQDAVSSLLVNRCKFESDRVTIATTRRKMAAAVD